MPRNLSSTTSGSVDKSLTRPCYLIQVDTNYWSTTSGITYDGHTYTANNIKVDFQPDEDIGSIIIPNDNFCLSPTLLASGINDSEVKIHLVNEDNLDTNDVELLADGYVSACGIVKNVINLAFINNKQINSLLPKLTVSAGNGFHHIPYDGQCVSWGGEIYVIERNF